MSDTTILALSAIRLDGGTQPRAIINTDLFGEYAEAIAAGAKLPPPVVFHDGQNRWLADGFHRYRAHQTLGRSEIEVDLRQGTRRDAVLFSAGANADHGLRRSNDDKRRAVQALLNDDEWITWSDREIARRCNVSHEFVRRLRPEDTGNVDSIERTFRHPKTKLPTRMQTGNIGGTVRPTRLVAGRVPDRRPDPSFGKSEMLGAGSASRFTGFAERKLLAFARAGEIEGAQKDAGSWVFETDKLKAWMVSGGDAQPEPAEPVLSPPAYDPEISRPMHAAIESIEALLAGVSAQELLAWWPTFIGGGLDHAAVTAATAWIADFADGFPAAERLRQSRIVKLLKEVNA